MYAAPKPKSQSALTEVTGFLSEKPLVRNLGLGVGVWRWYPFPFLWPISFLPFLGLRRLGRGGNASREPRPAPPPGPPGQEARKEPPGAMDGAVMEGPLFLQSQRFGTKVVWAGVAEPHQS